MDTNGWQSVIEKVLFPDSGKTYRNW